MNDVVVLDSLIQKRTEGIQTYSFMLLRNGKTFELTPEHKYEASFAKNGSLIKIVQMQINESKLIYGSAQLLDLPASDYQLEIREIIDDRIHAIYPSDRSLTFHIKQNNTDLPVGTVSSLTLDEFVKEFKNLVKDAGDSSNPNQGGNVEASIDTNKRTITINGKSLTIPEPVDLSGLASKDDIAGLVKQTELAEYAKKNDIPSPPDLTSYAKLSDLDKYVTTESVDEKLSKPTHSPMAYSLDRTTDPWTIWFDNGCGLQFPDYGTLATIYGYGFSANVFNSGWAPYPLIANIMSASHGSLTPDNISKINGGADYWAPSTKVINPIYGDVQDYDWSNVYFNQTSREGKVNYKDRQKVFLRVMYELGIWSYDDLKQFGLKKKG